MKKMRIALMMIVLAAISVESFAAMSMNEIRHEARFLSDRMGHELGLSNRQYDDVFEINFDFLHQANEVLDDMVLGYDDAIDYYYYLLDVRNEDLMYVLRNSQYRKFVNSDYFYRPIYMVDRSWSMRIWNRYSDRNYFYFSIPALYYSYNGAHCRIHFAHSFYADRYQHVLFEGAFRLWRVGYKSHRHDGWKCIGKKKHEAIGSRPWSNAKNYEKSSRDLRSGFVSVPSRDKDKRVVKVNSEESRRSAMIPNSSSRNAALNGNVSRSNSSSSSRSGSASVAGSRSNNNFSNKSSASSNRSSSSNSSVSRSSASNSSVSRSIGNSSSKSSISSNGGVLRNGSSNSGVSRSSALNSNVSRSSSASRNSASVSRSSNSSISRSSASASSASRSKAK